MTRPTRGPTAADGSLHPDRRLPTFERDVQRMFASIADRYDAFNHAATWGQDFLWRPRALWELARFHRGPVGRVLDFGCGTGAFARQIALHYPLAQVVGVDFSRTMVERAWRNPERGPAHGGVRFAVANVHRLPFPDGSFDVATNAFVARNLASLPGSFRELRRVLRPGGTLLTLEVSEPASPLVRRLFHAHFDRVVPLLGRAFGREGPYTYLAESLRGFPSVRELLVLMGSVGFGRTAARPMSRGIVTTYLAEASSEADARR